MLSQQRRGPLLRSRIVSIPVTLVILVMAFFTVQTMNEAYALDIAIPTTLPASLAGAATTAADVAASAGVATVASGVAVAAGGLLLGYAAGTLGTAAVTHLWQWASMDSAGNKTSPGYADPQPNPGADKGFTPYENMNVLWTNAYLQVNLLEQVYDVTGPVYRQPLIGNNTVSTTVSSANRDKSGYSTVFTIYTFCSDATTGAVYQSSSVGQPGLSIDGGLQYWTLPGCYVGGNAKPNDKFDHSKFLVGEPNAPLEWFPIGHPNRPGTTPTGPAGSTILTTKPTSKCSDGSTVVGAAITYTGSTNASQLPPITYPACPAETYRTKATTPTTNAAGSVVASPLPTVTAPVIPSSFPECNPAGRCQLVLLRKAVTGTITNCTGTNDCANWMTQTRRAAPSVTVLSVATNTTIQELPRTYPDGSTLECRWGPYVIAVDECATVPTEAAPNGPGTTTNGPNIGTGTIPTQPDDRNCISGAFTFNPLDWVYVPVKCVLRWAFVPDNATVTGWQTRIARLQSTGPLSVAKQGTTFFTNEYNAINGASCSNTPTVPIAVKSGRQTSFDPVCAIGQEVSKTGGIWYGILQAGCYLGFAYYMWIRFFRSVGSKDSVAAA